MSKSRKGWTDLYADRNQPALFDAPVQPKRRKKGTLKPPKPLERDIKRMIFQALKLHPLVAEVEIISVGCGQMHRPDGTPTAWHRWGEPGTPDIKGKIKSGQVFRIEVKTPARRHLVSPEQREMLAETRAAGGLAGVACSIDDAYRIIEDRV